MKYAFMQTHCREFRLAGMSRVLGAHRGGYPAWLHDPLSARSKINVVLTQRIRESYDQSMRGAAESQKHASSFMRIEVANLAVMS